ncbi:MAG TPA: FAD binding domain-containing protein [Gemmataceae bacterium]|nr:FAD binding domain-containing protein [Gemmataceae bacterium]
MTALCLQVNGPPAGTQRDPGDIVLLMRDHVRFYLNGRPQTVRGGAAFATLTEYLRAGQRLVGTKVVCAEGDCGACTVLVGRVTDGKVRYLPVDACIQFLYQLDGTHVITVEGLTRNGELHPVQQALVDHHGSQCGYCTPGIVMALAGWAADGAPADPAAARIALTGNLCRCTGYLPILDAAAALAVGLEDSTHPTNRYHFPEMLAAMRSLTGDPLQLTEGRRTFFAPTTLDEAVAFKAEHPDAVIVAGATELGVLRNKKNVEPRTLLSLARVPGLGVMSYADGRIVFGANVTWSQVERAVREPLPEFHRIVQRFGSPQIRNVATLVGNVAHGSPIADSLGLLSVMDAELELVSVRGVRQRSINGFYTGYKQKDLAADELIARVALPLPAAGERLRLYKVSRRFDLDIATFGAAIRVRVEDGFVRDAALAFMGVAPTVVRLPEAERFLGGRPFDEVTFRQAGRIARSEVRPISDVRGGREFRERLAENILTKFYFDETAAYGSCQGGAAVH